MLVLSVRLYNDKSPNICFFPRHTKFNMPITSNAAKTFPHVYRPPKSDTNLIKRDAVTL